MAHSYAASFPDSHNGFALFYGGPYGRPDMAYFKFTKAILEGQAIDVFNNGEMERDFTYIDDIIEGIVRLMPKVPHNTKPDTTNADSPFACII